MTIPDADQDSTVQGGCGTQHHAPVGQIDQVIDAPGSGACRNNDRYHKVEGQDPAVGQVPFAPGAGLPLRLDEIVGGRVGESTIGPLELSDTSGEHLRQPHRCCFGISLPVID